jgi:hypothetical protein
MKKKLSKLEKKLIKEVMKTNLTLLEKGIIAHQIIFTNFKNTTV